MSKRHIPNETTPANLMERRYLRGIELREAEQNKSADGRIGTLVGYAAVFNSLSEDLGGFRELIRPGAFKASLARGDDVRALVGHDSSQIIGRRAAGTLNISEDEKGLRVEIAVPDTTVGRDLIVSVKRGDLTAMSFGFSTQEDEWLKENKAGDIVRRRELIAADLYEVSVVAFPAYAETSVEARERSLSPGAILQRAMTTDLIKSPGAIARRDMLIAKTRVMRLALDLTPPRV
jgi:uncharacterized protein